MRRAPWLILGVASLAQAADVPLGASKLLVQDPSGDPLRRKMVVVGSVPAGSTVALPGDPTIGGATLTIVTAGGVPAEQTFDLPAPGWQTLPATRFKYTNRVSGGIVKSLLLKRSGSGAVKLKATISGRYGALAIVPPNPGDTASVVLAIGGGDTYCVSVGGAAGGLESRDDAKSWLVRYGAPAPCPTPPTTSTGSSS